MSWLRCTPFRLANRRRLQYDAKLRRRFGAPPLTLPLQQTKAQRRETVQRILSAKQSHLSLHSSADVRQKELSVEKRLFSLEARLEREQRKDAQLQGKSSTYAMGGLGDLEPLRSSPAFGLSELHSLKYDSPRDAMKYDPPPIAYTPLAARKLAEGNLWPSAPDPIDMKGVAGKELRFLRHRENMSPSAQHFSDKLAYHLRRSLKACPPHIGERIDFAEFILEEVIASRRSQVVYIVWNTVHPGARFEIEPQLLRLHYWVRRIIMEKMKTRPSVPREVHWVYAGEDRVERELPRKLVEEIKNYAGTVVSSLETRVQYLKALDTVQQRLKDVPWFMPYLWHKEEKARHVKQIRADVSEYEARRQAAKKQENDSESAVERRERGNGLKRSVAPSTQPPPSYIR